MVQQTELPEVSWEDIRRQTIHECWMEYGCAADGNAILTCGPHTGHVYRPMAFCESPEAARFLAEAVAKCRRAGEAPHSQEPQP